ncbi:hypothetical protein [Pseudomonas citronellolis]|uniref:hypothetical protein n=1 Tax=Pseudomonas citronellolis TaxID=53408 RepID=UPI0023E3CF4D|nr:hypothetical protein [Pseudomonas citronellolis]MDF3931670.1 hypothetical protein [Pseudomonas citronellolis]
MATRKLLVYYAWSRPQETAAPLAVIENRFPALFESRRMGYPRYEAFADGERFDQGIGGFLDCIMRRNFTAFVELAGVLTGQPVAEIERVTADGTLTRLEAGLLERFDTLVIISFDSLRTQQQAGDAEVEAVRQFLSRPDNLVFVGPHHDIGATPALPHDERLALQLADFLHHGDRTIPPCQQFGGYARTLLASLGVPVTNRFGLRPAATADGAPAPIEVAAALDRLALLDGVDTFNLHPHLPHLERQGAALDKLDVLARQRIDPTAPPHPFANAHASFDALLQSRVEAFGGTLLVGDATLWSSTAGGVESLQRLWTNVLQRRQQA